MNPRDLAWLLLFIAVAIAAAMYAFPSFAHEVGCTGNPVPSWVKLECCGKADEHGVEPDQITRGSNDEYIVRSGLYTFIVPEDKVLPSADGCSHIFYADQTGYEARDAGQPMVYCFLIPMNF